MYLIFDTETTGLPINFSKPINDFENWDKSEQDKLRNHVHEFFQLTIGKDEPDNDNEWINIQLAVLFKTTEYLKEVAKRFKKRLGK